MLAAKYSGNEKKEKHKLDHSSQVLQVYLSSLLKIDSDKKRLSHHPGH